MSTLQAGTTVREGSSDVADVIGPAFEGLLGTPAVEIEFWDGSTIGRRDGPGRLRVNSIDAIRRIVWSPDELGLARAFVMGDIDVVGPVAEILRALQNGDPHSKRVQAAALPKFIAAAHRLGGIGTAPPPAPAEEMIPRGRRHSLRRDKQVISHHYDVGNDFYEIVLGPAMTYSCARFVESDTSLVDAQAAKHDLICRKLGLHEPALRGDADGVPARLLDVGCGWGSMAMHAAQHYGARRGRGDDQRRTGDVRPATCHRGRSRRSRRDPHPGLPRDRRRSVRRDQLDRDVRARRVGTPLHLLRAPVRVARRRRTSAQPRDLVARWISTAAAAASCTATCSPTVS